MSVKESGDSRDHDATHTDARTDATETAMSPHTEHDAVHSLGPAVPSLEDMTANLDDEILEISLARCVFPLRHPVRFGMAAYRSRGYVLMRLRTRTTTAYGAAMTRDTPLAEALLPLAERVVGMSTRAALDLVNGSPRENVPAQAALVRARSLANLTLWDCVSRTLDMPMRDLLGSRVRSHVDVVAVAGYLIDVRGPDAVVDEVARLAGQGYRNIKLMVDLADPDDLYKLLKRCRDVGEVPLELSLDLHFSVPTLDAALRLVEPLEPLRLAFIEDLFPPSHWRDMLKVAGRCETPLAAGEDVTHPAMFLDLLEAVDLLRVDAATCGGIEAALAGVAAAADAGKRVMPHGSPWLAAQFAGALSVVDRVEIAAPLDNGDRFGELCPSARLHVDSGTLTIGDECGVDPTLDWDQVERLSEWSWTSRQR